MDFDYDMNLYPMVPSTSTTDNDQLTNLPFDFGIPEWTQFGFDGLTPSPVEDDHTLSPFPPLQPPADFYSLLLSPPDTSGSSSVPSLSSPSDVSERSSTPPFPPPPDVSDPLSTPPLPPLPSVSELPSSPSLTSPLGVSRTPLIPSLPSLPTPDLPLAGPSSAQPPAVTQPPPPPVTQPEPEKIAHFDFCPFTRYGQVCGYVTWARSGNKQIKRHIKGDHFPDTSLGYECPNLECAYGGYRFLRKDAYVEHRKACDLAQAPGYIPLPNIVSGSDAEVNRWMKARNKPRREIIKRLKEGTPWSNGLLEPIEL